MQRSKLALSGAIAAALVLSQSLPASARFLTVDPVPASPNSGENFNRYWYAADNPNKFTDPDGRYFTFGGDFAYGAQTLLSMGRVASTDPELARRFQVMALSKIEHRINPIGEDQPREAVNPSDPKSAATGTVDPESAQNRKGSATITWWDPDHHETAPGGDPRSGTPDGQMAHDVFSHVYEADQGIDDDAVNPKTNHPKREGRAQDVERRYIRGLEAQKKPDNPVEP